MSREAHRYYRVVDSYQLNYEQELSYICHVICKLRNVTQPNIAFFFLDVFNSFTFA
jgi:hypothetical protein